MGHEGLTASYGRSKKADSDTSSLSSTDLPCCASDFPCFFLFFFKVSRFHVSHKDYGLQNSIEEKRAFRERGEKIFIYRSSLVRRYRSGNYHLFMSTVMSDFFS